MDIQKMLREEIAAKVLSAYDGDWAVMVYDLAVARILQPIYTKSDFLAHSIVKIRRLELEEEEEEEGEDTENWDFPAIYFVKCDQEASVIINKAYDAKKYSAIRVFSIVEPSGLNPLIKATAVHLGIQAVEERLFICPVEDLRSIAHACKAKPSINYLPSLQKEAEALAESIERQTVAEDEDEEVGTSPSAVGGRALAILLLDRAVDLYTPLLHFFTFKSALVEMTEEEHTGIVYTNVRYKHLAEVNAVLQGYINRLNRNKQILSKKKVDVLDLGKMVVEAPANIEIKDAVVKYSELLNKAIRRLNSTKELVEAEQILATEYDKHGKKVKKCADYFFDFLRSSKYSIEDRRRLLFLMKVNGFVFTMAEQQQLEMYGFTSTDISARINTSSHIKRRSRPDYQYDVSRYEPIIADLVTDFTDNKPVLQAIDSAPVHFQSLRKSNMISKERKCTNRVVVVYVQGGITVEESRLAYALSDSLGIEMLIGGDKVLTPADFITDLLEKYSDPM